MGVQGDDSRGGGWDEAILILLCQPSIHNHLLIKHI